MIPALKHFLAKINKELHKNVFKVQDGVMYLLKNHDWVGNVRELENTLMQAVVLSTDDVLLKENILLREKNINEEMESNVLQSLDEIEKKHIKKVLDHFKWDKTKAAAVLKISLPTLYSKIKNYGLEELS